MKEEVAFMLFLLMGSTGFCAFMWYRSAQARKKIEDRLWGIAAAQGLPVTAISGDVPMPIINNNPRIDQLETQIDSMAQQMDRLAESQEFLSRVLTDRIEQLPDSRLRTPH